MKNEFIYSGFLKRENWFGAYVFEQKNKSKVWIIDIDKFYGVKKIVNEEQLLTGIIENINNGRYYEFTLFTNGKLQLFNAKKYNEPNLPIPKYVQTFIKDIGTKILEDKDYLNNLEIERYKSKDNKFNSKID